MHQALATSAGSSSRSRQAPGPGNSTSVRGARCSFRRRRRLLVVQRSQPGVDRLQALCIARGLQYLSPHVQRAAQEYVVVRIVRLGQLEEMQPGQRMAGSGTSEPGAAAGRSANLIDRVLRTKQPFRRAGLGSARGASGSGARIWARGGDSQRLIARLCSRPATRLSQLAKEMSPANLSASDELHWQGV
jgi:hypothetical protein